MNEGDILCQELEAVNRLKLSLFAFLTSRLGSGLRRQRLKAEVLVAGRAVQLAYFEKIHGLDAQDTKLYSVSVLFEEGLLHTLLFTSIALEPLAVVRVREQDFS